MATYQETSNYSYIGDQDTLGGLPVVESNKAYIALFRGVVDSTPEQIANASFFITYLVDEKGNVAKISEDSFAQKDIQYTFAVGDDVQVIIDQGTLLNPQLAGAQKVSGVGSFVPILVSQTGSSINANVNNLQYFNPGQVPAEESGEDIKNFLGLIHNSSSTGHTTPGIYRPTTGNTVPNNLVLDQNGTSMNGKTADKVYASESVPAPARSLVPNLTTWLTSSSPDVLAATWSYNQTMTGVPIGLSPASGSYQLADPLSPITNINMRASYGVYNFGLDDATLTVAIFARNPGGNWSNGQNFGIPDPIQNITIPGATSTSDYSGRVTLTTGSITWNLGGNMLSASREYLVVATSGQVVNKFGSNGTVSAVGNDNCGNVYWAIQDQIIGSQTITTPRWKLEVSAQNPSLTTVASQLPFFTTGSSTSTVITGSETLTGQYGDYQTLPTASADFGFSPINYPFQVQTGDKIRFGYDPSNTFTIFNVEEPPASPRLYLTLDREIGGTLNINNFVLYRNLADGKFLTLDVAKNDPQIGEVDFTGVIIPKFASQQLQENASQIVAKLKSEGVLAED